MDRLGALSRPPFDAFGTAAVAAMLATLLAPPLLAYEVAWEVAASLGYAACVALILCLRAAPAAPARLTAYRFTLHRVAGDAAVALAAGHVAVMLAADPFVIDYLGWQAPRHVLFGMAGGIALLAAVATREPALPARLRRGGRRLHAWIGVVAVAGIVGHLWTSSAKPLSAWRAALLLAAIALPALPALARTTGLAVPRPPAANERGAAGMVRAVLVLIALTMGALVAAPLLAAFLRG